MLLCISIVQPAKANQAVNAAVKKDFQTAFAKARSNPLEKKIVEWLYLRTRSEEAGFDRIKAFLSNNPRWPGRTDMKRKAEWLLFRSKLPPRKVVSHFKSYKAMTGNGRAALAEAQLALGNAKQAKSGIKRVWKKDVLGKSAEARIMSGGLRKFITASDQKARMDLMLYKRSIAAGLRAAKRLGPAHVKLANARIAVIKRRKDASKRINAIQGRLAKDTGLLYNRAQWNRRKGRHDKFRHILLSAPKSHARLVDPVEWWTERRTGARIALGGGHKRDAYKIASSHGFTNGYFFADGEFLAGFIALRILNQPKKALNHFTRLRAKVTKDRSVSRTEYWLGRVNEKLGNSDAATAHYQKASAFPRIYYGQLAINRLGLKPAITFPPGARPTGNEIRAFNSKETVRAMRLLYKAGHKKLLGYFFRAILYRTKTSTGYRLLAELADDFKQKHWVVRIGKIGAGKGHPMLGYAYPKGGMPKLPSTKVEDAFIYGLIRQESEFNPSAKSYAGARGLMQIMPGTARYIARDHGMRYSKSRLTSDPAYNARLGALHLQDLSDMFSGSYIMMAAAYNAGKGNVRKWNKAYGDPRSGQIDPIDWVELIPFTETRNYVQHVLENTQVYRARLTRASQTIRTKADLNRGGGIASLINRTIQ